MTKFMSIFSGFKRFHHTVKAWGIYWIHQTLNRLPWAGQNRVILSLPYWFVSQILSDLAEGSHTVGGGWVWSEVLWPVSRFMGAGLWGLFHDTDLSSFCRTSFNPSCLFHSRQFDLLFSGKAQVYLIMIALLYFQQDMTSCTMTAPWKWSRNDNWISAVSICNNYTCAFPTLAYRNVLRRLRHTNKTYFIKQDEN